MPSRAPKRSVVDLAVFGGPALFEEPRHVGRPNLGDRARFLKRVELMLDRRWLSNDGPLVREFEERVASYCGVGHCVAVANATLGLELVVRALALSGEIIVPAFSFIATAHSLQWLGVRPRFCDVDPVDLNLDPRAVQGTISPETVGILGVHLWGRPASIERLGAIAAGHNIPLMFDAAHAFGCAHKGRSIGGFGIAEVFSFHATKFINSFEGGVVATNDPALADAIRLSRNFGFAGYDLVTGLGTNAKLSEVHAAMGLTSLEAMDSIIEQNRLNYSSYLTGLEHVPGVRVMQFDPLQRQNYQYVTAMIEPEVFQLSADDLAIVLHAERALARRYFKPGLHRMEPYRSERPPQGPFPVAEAAAENAIVFPTGSAMGTDDIRDLCDAITFVARNAVEISSRLRP